MNTRSSGTGSVAGCVTGRFQPLHLGHLELLLRVAAREDRLIVGITNPDAAARVPVAANASRHLRSENPFTYYERLGFVQAALAGAGVPPDAYDVVPFPLHQPGLWFDYVPSGTRQYVRVYSDWEAAKVRSMREHGYPVVAIEGEEKAYEATAIRSALRHGRDWRESVPPGVAELVDRMLHERSLDQRCGP